MALEKTSPSGEPSVAPPGKTGLGFRMVTLVGILALIGVGGFFFLKPEGLPTLEARAQTALENDGNVGVVADAMERSGYSREARIWRAKWAFKKGDINRALGLLDNFPIGNSLSVQANCLRGEILLATGRAMEAGPEFQAALKVEPENPTALLGLAAVWYDLGALVRAIGVAEKAASFMPNDGRPLHLLGSIHLQLGERAFARERLEQANAKELAPFQAREVMNLLLELELEEGRTVEAEALVQKLALEKDPTPRELAMVAWLEELKADNEGAKQAALIKIAAQTRQPPVDPVLFRWLGEAYLRNNQEAQALDPFENAIRLEPQNQQIRHLLARALDRLGKAEQAQKVRTDLEKLEKSLKRLTELNGQVDAHPLDPVPRLEMAKICEEIGRADWAAHWRQSAKGLGGEGK